MLFFLGLIALLYVAVSAQSPVVDELGGNWSLQDEGFIVVKVGTRKGTLCADSNFNMNAAKVVCRELGQGNAYDINKNGFYNGQALPKVVAKLNCIGTESKIADCTFVTSNIICSLNQIAGVMCENPPPASRPTTAAPSPTTAAPSPTTAAPSPTTAAPSPTTAAPSPTTAAPTGLPDLQPDKDVLSTSIYVQRIALGELQCAIEEKCVSSSGLALRNTDPNWATKIRYLLRFSSSVKNVGDVDFRTDAPANTWQWHECHGHFHSMEAFASYDIVDASGTKKAEGHKASFCLMDVSCDAGVTPKFRCGSTADDRDGQGISVGCSDDYTAELDCQWIDVTDLAAGNYIIRIHVNPDRKVTEKKYDNNIASCDIVYGGGTTITASNCR